MDDLGHPRAPDGDGQSPEPPGCPEAGGGRRPGPRGLSPGARSEGRPRRGPRGASERHGLDRGREARAAPPSLRPPRHGAGPTQGSPADFFSAAVRDGRIFGRGTVDMKGALAAMAGALVDIRDSGGLASGKVTLAAVIDEEMESLGAEALILSGFKADGAVIGEPTENRVAIGHKGLEWLEVGFKGRAAHGAMPEAGVSAIAAAAQFASLVEGELIPAFERRRDPVLGLPVVNLGTIKGGQQPSMVAADCTIQLDRRWVTTETIDQVVSDLEEILSRVRAARPGLKTELKRMPGGMATMLHGPLVIDPAHPLVEAAQGAFVDLGLAAAPLTVFPAWTDGALISREAGIPTLIWGPGELALAHSAEESVRLDEVVLAARLYAAAARRFTTAR
ncbi:MAG: M20/M25/M40 family metallo-hydrolase [Ignavibacteriales bacterium]|nr:M20/M25/M40 family metallo-hydrolase [Ignavibacteriales bacterium]